MLTAALSIVAACDALPQALIDSVAQGPYPNLPHVVSPWPRHSVTIPRILILVDTSERAIWMHGPGATGGLA
jgi:hypothetical protein